MFNASMFLLSPTLDMTTSITTKKSLHFFSNLNFLEWNCMSGLTYSTNIRLEGLWSMSDTTLHNYDTCTTVMKICLGLTSDCRVHKAVLVIQILVWLNSSSDNYHTTRLASFITSLSLFSYISVLGSFWYW